MKEETTVTKNTETLDVRVEFGFSRTVCSCEECVNNCHHIPGYLIPADIERIAHALGYTNLLQFAFDNLLASPGATVVQAVRVFQIPTLVPRRKEDGSCIFLDENNRCRIHKVSPFGCSFFDAHQSSEEANTRSSRGLQEVARYWAVRPRSHAYTVIWKLLNEAGHHAIPAHIARRAMVESSAITNQNLLAKK